MKNLLALISLYSFPMIGVFAQPGSETPKCQNFFFNQMVKSSIDFTVPVIDVDDLHERPDQYIILDAREKPEFEVSHIRGARYVGYEEMNHKLLSTLDKDAPIAIYCSIGYRSEKVGEKLLEMGFTNVQNVYGSIFEWANRGYDLVDSKGRPTQEIHGFSKSWGIWIKKKNLTVVYP